MLLRDCFYLVSYDQHQEIPVSLQVCSDPALEESPLIPRIWINHLPLNYIFIIDIRGTFTKLVNVTNGVKSIVMSERVGKVGNLVKEPVIPLLDIRGIFLGRFVRE